MVDALITGFLDIHEGERSASRFRMDVKPLASSLQDS
jgi:hypothetical protein